MTRRVSAESFVPSPLTLDWTITQLLDWIGDEDARCHDERLAELLDVVNRALGESDGVAGVPVASVWALAMRVAGEPSLGVLRLADLVASEPVAAHAPTSVDDGILMPV